MSRKYSIMIYIDLNAATVDTLISLGAHVLDVGKCRW